jgi:hypothetical protein
MRFPAIFLPPTPRPYLPGGDKVGPVGHRHLGEMDLGPRVVAVGGAQQRVAQHVGQLLPVQATLPLQNRFKTGFKTGSKPVIKQAQNRLWERVPAELKVREETFGISAKKKQFLHTMHSLIH